MRKLIITLSTLGLLFITASPASAHFGDWHQSSCRPDVWHIQQANTWDSRADYWTEANGYMTVKDHPWSPSGWGNYDRYAGLGWQCDNLGAPVENEWDIWNCYGATNTCGWHRVQGFENGYMVYPTEGRTAYITRVVYY